jgi:cellulose synthase/poly-beta-1,6-N-acetylglucosamine synthase-like glycosyltransferase
MLRARARRGGRASLSDRMSAGLVVLTALVVPYLALMLLIALGMRWPTAATPRVERWPSVDVVVAARDEEPRLPATLTALRALDYPGVLRVIVVDDRSTDGTADVVRAACTRDPRLTLVQVRRTSRRMAPKVHAVAHGVRAGRGEIVLTTDADCVVEPRWARAMVAPFADPRVVWTLGSVTTRGPGEARGFRERFEAIDWLSLMLVSRSLARLGWSLASSANAQAYRRSAFDAAGGFGLAGRAPSGDEDLLAQRLARQPGARAVFVDDPAARVLTASMPSWRRLIDQRRRWVRRYQHVEQYHLGFWLGITLLGAQSLALSIALMALPLAPGAAATVLGLWGAKLAIEVPGMRAGMRLLGRADLVGGVLGWALLHPFFISLALIGSALPPAPTRGPAPWRGPAHALGYRRRLWRARWRRWRRRASLRA